MVIMMMNVACSSSPSTFLVTATSSNINHVNLGRAPKTVKMPLFLPSSSSSDNRKTSGLTDLLSSSGDKVINGHIQEEKLVTSMVNMTAIVTVRTGKKAGVIKEMMARLPLSNPLNHNESVERCFVFQLVSNEIDPMSMKPKLSWDAVVDWRKERTQKSENGRFSFEVEFVIESNFGVPGAILVSNKYQEELYLETVSFQGHVHFACNSWVQPAHVHKEKRIFFANKVHLPCQTPEGIRELREKELELKRGDGIGLRLSSDRIYDYEVYNDLGNPDKGVEFARATLGGKDNPHPRRCRTGRPPTTTDTNAEMPVNTSSTSIYVPRDEAVEETKREDVSSGKMKGMLKNIPTLIKTLYSENKDFYDITNVYRNKSTDTKAPKNDTRKRFGIPNVATQFKESIEEFIKFGTPKNISRDTICCLRDDELGRQAVAGINPLSIEKLKVFPPVSKLDSSVYGPPESALREEHILGQLNGMSVQQALDENKLFILDYHDAYLPFLERINALEGRRSYGTRTIFFLTPMGTLKPVAIELSLVPMNPNTSSKQVLTPPVDATTNWLWQLAKAHVCSNDAGVHQLVHHWLRVHACMEPFIIATHRQLSVMHPVFKLLHPHLRYTLSINAMAREDLINADGVIESDFTPGKYCMQLSCVAYRDWWRFDLEGLPDDLLRRGVAVPEATQEHGLRLLIEDYPYANDGLLIWSAIQDMVRTYVNHYYPESSFVQSDNELQAWYGEVINVGHADVREADWWPKLSTPDDLSKILTTLIWLTSAQHAALNFGQYPYGGYVPTRPPLMRRLLPQQSDPDYASFVVDPQGYFLSSLPSLFQATKFMAVIEIISGHSRDEEYIGERRDLSTWASDPAINEAFYRFSMEIKKIEKEIERRNADPSLRNRCGAGVSPYELLMPSSSPGVTGRGVPNSITV